jgi:hypothetical protein
MLAGEDLALAKNGNARKFGCSVKRRNHALKTPA